MGPPPPHPKKQGGPPVFGGPWSSIKIDKIERYLKYFNTVLKNQDFERVYIDAFAGAGAFIYSSEREPTLFQIDKPTAHRGSAALALDADPPFDRILFIDEKKSNVEALQAMIDASGHPRAKAEQGNANAILLKACERRWWKSRRGVVFLDPFGMSVDWSTLEAIAHTRALDVWYLFSLGGTTRNLPLLASQLDSSKRNAVTRILGTEDWFDAFYTIEAPAGSDIFGEVWPATATRGANIDDIEKFVFERLSNLFPHVEPPCRLKGQGNRSLFSLFFAVSNPNQKAIALAIKGARHILKMQ
jgi:three-Cys-motif partner protein